MKTSIIFFFISLGILYYCTTPFNNDETNIDFGIYEAILNTKLPDTILQQLITNNIILEKDSTKSVIGYALAKDSIDLSTVSIQRNFRLLKTNFTVDKDNKYCAIVLVQHSPIINLNDINKAIAKGKDVQLRFNMQGAKKWSNITKFSNGKLIAFMVDDKIVHLTMINAKINTGVALIKNLPSEEEAIRISQLLNSQ